MPFANPFARKTQRAVLSVAAAVVAATMGADTLGAEESSTTLSPTALQEIAQLEAGIDRIEAATIERLAQPPDNQVQQIELLGKLMLYDKQLSVNRNEACAFCHMPETGFTGPVSELNRTTGCGLRRLSRLAAALPRFVRKRMGTAGFCGRLAGRRGTGLRPARAAARE
ncbi:cytochrome c peroxidase [Bradyrhizobium sp.]